jgi:hypothetical protein
MKKTALFTIFLLTINVLSAQNNRISWGIKLGGNIGAPIPFGNIPEGATGAPIVGLNLGSWISYHFSAKTSLKLEFNYSVKGASFKTPLDSQYYEDIVYLPKPGGGYEESVIETFFNGAAEGKFDNQYLEWPLYIQYKVGKKLFLTGGIYFAYMFSTATYANGEGTVGYSTTIVSRTIPFEEELNKLDYGLRLGVNYTNGAKFSFDADLSYGIPSIFTESYKTIDYPINNFYFQFGVSYNFGKELGFGKVKLTDALNIEN